MKVTVKDIARTAGVSQSTVSKVLNNYAQVKESTRKKVLKAVEELGFVPDLVARSLVMNRTGTIGLIVGDIANPFFSETAKVIIAEARKSGIDVILSDTDYRSELMEMAVKNMLARRVDGILISAVDRKDTFTTDLYKKGYPLVLFNRHPDSDLVNYIVLDNGKGSRLAVNHLVQLGHRRISFISGPLQFSTFHHRYLGYKNAIQEHNIPYIEEFVFDGDPSYESINDYLKELLNKDEKPTAFFAATDQLAIHVMDALARMGFNVPLDFSVIGFDNIDISSNPHINLTTVSQNKKEMAKLALEKLLALIDEGEIPEQPIHITLEPKLIIRKTVGVNYEQFHYETPRGEISLSEG
ncbi:LacI family DNA-binding transcriptional regulator [Ammoniphilus resinae]|uniref:LacI family transcriptional regulator n=1 Tax=Ammoniphilus resinae TaxID=861532 RepID=A0ABS4GNS6_9BACL|nr:LacI family DNA-binding transcriptional regulator [Ammoniphilus resinae]MBP1931918.1 LacI family transcriptional regulator [Ammoniphilus resinae]